MKQKYFQRNWVVGLCVLGLLSIAVVVFAALTAKDFTGCSSYGYGCTYDIVWDGWKGTLFLGPDGTGTLEQPGKRYSVRHQVALNPQDVIDGRKGPGYLIESSLKHRIVFWVDFKNTPGKPKDDQRFDGYMMTQTKDAIAGITWWNNIPFGFYATNKQAPLI